MLDDHQAFVQLLLEPILNLGSDAPKIALVLDGLDEADPASEGMQKLLLNSICRLSGRAHHKAHSTAVL